MRHSHARNKDYSMIYIIQGKLYPKKYTMVIVLLEQIRSTEHYLFPVMYVITANTQFGILVKHCANSKDCLFKYEQMLDYTLTPGVCNRQEFIDSLFDLN